MNILALSEANILSFHSMALIAAADEKGISAKKISELTKCSRNHLFKVLEILIRAGVIYSTRGPNGGYYMKKPAEEVVLLDIYEALSGKINYDDLLVTKSQKTDTKLFFDKICYDLSIKYIDYMKNTKISDLGIKAEFLLRK